MSANRGIVLVLLLALVALFAASLGRHPPVHRPLDAFVIATAGESGTLDPARLTDVDWTPASQMFETLVRADAQGRLEPGLALSWERQDPRTWVVHLRRGVQFHDGRTFDARAAQFSLRRAARLSAGWQHLDFERIDVTDALTVSIQTARPFAPLPLYLSYINFAMVSPAADASEAHASHPSGTGPFALEEYVPGEQARLVRNDAYWGHKPGIARLAYDVIPDSLTRVMALESGQIDLMRAVPLAEIPRLRALPSVTLLMGPGRHVHHLVFNRSASPFRRAFDDVRVRRAFNHAVDRQAIVDVVLNGAGVPATGPVPPWIASAIRVGGYPHDVVLARRLLTEAGWPPGRLRLRYNFSPLWLPQNSTLAELVQAQLREAGIDLTLDPMEFGGAERAERAGWTDVRHRGNVFVVGGAFYGLWSRYSSANSGTASVYYSNPRVDALLDCAERASEESVETRCLEGVQRLITDDAADVPLYYEYEVVAAAKGVTGLRPNALAGPDLTEVTVAQGH